VISPGVFGSQVEIAVVGVAAVYQVAEPVIDVVDYVIVESEDVFDLGFYESGMVFVAVVSVADVAEPQAYVDKVLSFDVLLPVSGGAAEVDNSGRPKFVSLPNVYYYANSASSSEVVD
jgi:hypothetical protein